MLGLAFEGTWWRATRCRRAGELMLNMMLANRLDKGAPGLLMTASVPITLPQMPDCWESCGNCAGEAIRVTELLVREGEWVWCNDPLLMIESDKTLLDIPAPQSGKVVELLVEEGDEIEVGQLLLRLDTGAPRPE